MRGLRQLRRFEYDHLVNLRQPLNAGLLAWLMCIPGLMYGTTWYNLLSYPAGTTGAPLYNGALTNFASPQTSTSGFNPPTRMNSWGHIAFDGSNDFVNLGSIIPNTNDFTIMMWVNVVSHLSGFDTLLGQGQTGQDFDLLLDASTHKFDFYMNFGGTHAQSTTVPSAGTWYHVAVPGLCYAGNSTWYMYVNAALEATTNQGATRNTAAINCYLGGTPSYTRPANILLDDVRIYNRALSQGEIFRLYTESSFRYQHVLRQPVLSMGVGLLGAPATIPAATVIAAEVRNLYVGTQYV